MKKTAAILLFGIFAFNLFGYRIIASFLENQQNEKMELALDENEYSESQLISIKQPTNLPYYNNSPTFQRMSGEAEIGGVYYKFVKCRIYNDSLELLCIPDAGKTKIQAAKVEFSKLASDVQSSNDKKKSPVESKSFKKTISEFEEEQPRAAFNASLALPMYLIQNTSFVNVLSTKSIEQPPDYAV